MKKKHIIKNIIRIIFLLLISISVYSQKHIKVTDPLRILFVGNSYTYFGKLPELVQTIAESQGVALIAEGSTAGSATLENHLKGELGLKTTYLIKTGNYDMVILQDQSKRPINYPEKTIRDIGLLSDMIKNNGATPYLFITWARKNKPLMQKIITKTYLEAAEINKAKVVPVGLAWKLASKLRPDLSLYRKDGSHPSELGTYLSACLFYSVLTGKRPTGIIPQSRTINNQDAEFCQVSAEEAINIFSNRKILFPDRCLGQWKGIMLIHRNGKIRNSVPVRLTVSKTSDPAAWIWKTEYLSKKHPVVKDYILRSKDNKNNLYLMDEGNDLVLYDYLFNNKLYSIFKTNEILLTASYELRGSELIFEVTSGKKLKENKMGVINYSVTNLQKVVFRKVKQ